MRGSLAGFYTILNEHPGLYCSCPKTDCNRIYEKIKMPCPAPAVKRLRQLHKVMSMTVQLHSSTKDCAISQRSQQ